MDEKVATETPGDSCPVALIAVRMSASLANFYVGRTVLWTSGALAGVAAAIQGYAASGGLLTFTPTPVAPVAGDSFVIL